MAANALSLFTDRAGICAQDSWLESEQAANQLAVQLKDASIGAFDGAPPDTYSRFVDCLAALQDHRPIRAAAMYYTGQGRLPNGNAMLQDMVRVSSEATLNRLELEYQHRRTPADLAGLQTVIAHHAREDARAVLGNLHRLMDIEPANISVVLKDIGANAVAQAIDAMSPEQRTVLRQRLPVPLLEATLGHGAAARVQSLLAGNPVAAKNADVHSSIASGMSPSASPADRIAALRARHENDPQALLRLDRMQLLAAQSVQRAVDPRIGLLHLRTQIERAVDGHQEAHGVNLVGFRDRLAQADAALAKGNMDEARKALQIENYPWQKGRFQIFTDLPTFNRIGASGHHYNKDTRILLTEYDPASDSLRPYEDDGRPEVLMFAGNRASIGGTEWEATSPDRGKPLIEGAQAYVKENARAMYSMLASTGPSRPPKLVVPVFGAIDHGGEQRLVNFKLAQDPTFTHPHLLELAKDLWMSRLARKDPTTHHWVPRTPDDLLHNARPIVSLEHSYGTTISRELINEGIRIARKLGFSEPVIKQYFSRGYSLQMGGYVDKNQPDIPGPRRVMVVSPLDEIASGSPFNAGAHQAPRYTSPLEIGDAWSRFSDEDLHQMAQGHYASLQAPPLEPAREGVQLWQPALHGSIGFDPQGREVTTFEVNRLGHKLGFYADAVKQWMPNLLRELVANAQPETPTRTHSDEDVERMYRKKLNADTSTSARFHGHVDAQQPLPRAAFLELENVRFRRDDFSGSLQPGPRPPNTPAPVNHMTFLTNDPHALQVAMMAADKILRTHHVHAYTEAEFVALDKPVQAKREFDVKVFDELAPLARPGIDDENNTFECPIIADGVVIGKETRVLPIKAIKRPLDPQGQVTAGQTRRDAHVQEYFRESETHVTVRKPIDPRTLALMTAIGFTQPTLPKTIELPDGTLMKQPDGRTKVIEDMPMTIQAASESGMLIGVTDWTVKNILGRLGGFYAEPIEGVEEASVKYEPARGYGLYNGVSKDGSPLRFDPQIDEPEAADHFEWSDKSLVTKGSLSVRGAETGRIDGLSIGARSDQARLSNMRAEFEALETMQKWPLDFNLEAVVRDRAKRRP